MVGVTRTALSAALLSSRGRCAVVLEDTFVQRVRSLPPTLVLNNVMITSNKMVPIVTVMRNVEMNATPNASPPIGESRVIRTMPPNVVRQIDIEVTKDAMSSSSLSYCETKTKTKTKCDKKGTAREVSTQL